MRIKAIYRLRFENTTVMLCRVLHVNRSTYYNFIYKKPSKREKEKHYFRKLLLEIYMKVKKRIGTRAFKIPLLRDHGVKYLRRAYLKTPQIKCGQPISLIFPSDIRDMFTSAPSLISTLENALFEKLVIGVMRRSPVTLSRLL